MVATCARAAAERRSRLQAGQDVEEEAAAVDLLAHQVGHLLGPRRPDRHLVHREPARVLRHHPDDGVRTPVEMDDLTDDVGPRAEAPLPETVAQQDDVSAAGPVLVRREAAPQPGSQSEKGQIVVGRLQALHLLGLASVHGEREGGERRVGKGAEDRLPIADGLERG